MTVLENILSQEIVQRLGWTLLHFVWQAAAVALLLTTLLAAMRKSSSNMRYTVACMALGLIVLLPVVTFQLVSVSAPEPAVTPPPAQAPVVAPIERVIELSTVEAPAAEPPVMVENAGHAPAVGWRQRLSEKLETALPHVVSAWLIGVFALSIWHLGGWTQLQRLRRKMVKPVRASLRTRLNELAERLGVKRAVQLTESALVRIPTVVGWLRPVILLPASAITGLTSEQLDAILAHELAHIRRYDYLVNMLQTIVETLGFYHPAVWWVSHKIRTEREHCCDDLAIVATGDRVRYARALTSMEEIRGRYSELAVTATGGNLLSRISRLVGKDSAEKSFSWIPAVTVILLLVALIISTTLALNTNDSSPDAESNTNKSDNELLNAGNNSNTKVLIEAQTLHVNNDFLEQVGLDADSLKNSNSWTQYRVDNSSNPSMFVIDSNKQEMLLKNVDESEGSSSISHIYLMAMSGREATIKNISGHAFKSQELGRFIKIKPKISQDGQSTYLDCELLTRWFVRNFKLPSGIPAAEIGKYQVNAENALLSDNHTLLILGGKPTSDIEGQKNEILLIKTSIVPSEQSDDVDSKASSYNVANFVVKMGSKASELLRICLDLDLLEAGRYVEIKDIGQRERGLRQVDTGDIGRNAREDFPAYADYIDFEIRSNFDLSLSTKRYTKGSFFEHDKWDAYFTGPDTVTGNGRFSKTTLCVSAWRVKLWQLVKIDDDVASLVAVIIKPSKPQKPSAQVLLDKMLEHRSRVKNLQYVAENHMWRDVDVEQDKLEEQIKRMRERGSSERIIERLRDSLSNVPESRYRIYKCTTDNIECVKIEQTGGTYDSSGKKIPSGDKHVWAWNGVRHIHFHQRGQSPGSVLVRNTPRIATRLWHPWRSSTGTFSKHFKETIAAGKPVRIDILKDGAYRVAFDYKTSQIVATIHPSKGYTCTQQDHYDKQGKLTSRNTATYEEVAEGIWFPVSGQRQEYTADGSVSNRTTFQTSQIKINDPAFNAGYFDVYISKGAHVRDFTRNAEHPEVYRYGEPRKGYDDVVQGGGEFVAGFVVDENGSPVPGVHVEVCGQKKLKPDGKFSWTFSGGFEIFNAVTDSEGRFAIELDEDGFYNLRFQPERHAAIMAYGIPVGKENLKVTLPEGGTISGRVVRMENGRKVPIPSVEVKAEQSDRSTYNHLGFDQDRKTVTDSEGRFRFDHLRTKMRSPETRHSDQWEYSPRAWTLSCKKTSKTVLFYEGANTGDIELVLKPDYSNPISLIGQPLSKSENLKKDMDHILSDSRASKFQMAWHGSGAGRREGMALEPGCLRVYEIRMLERPAREATSLSGSEAQYGRMEFEDFGKTKFTCGLKKSSGRNADPDIFFIDMNRNGRLEKEESHKGIPIYEGLDKIHYGVIDIPLRDQDQLRTHRVFAWYGKYDDFYLVSHCYMQGRIRLGDEEVTAVLVDYNCDGRYDSNRGLPDHDRIGWDADGDGKIVSWEQHFVGSYLVWDKKVFQVGCTPDGQTVAVVPVEVAMGRLQMPTSNAFVRLVGDVGPINLRITGEAVDVPAGTYRVDYLYIEEPDDDGKVTRMSKSGRYFDKPWVIRTGTTTKISRSTCIITDRDKLNDEARMRELRDEGPQPKIASLLDEPLANLDELNIDIDPEKVKGRRILVCFWDMNQRPSRNMINELSKREKKLQARETVTVLIHTSDVETAKVKEGLADFKIPLVCGNIKNDTRRTLFRWGVRAQPWLILTDRKGIVRAEGLSIEQLDEKLEEGPVEAEQAWGDAVEVTGRVKDPQGRPVSGASVTLFQTKQEYATDADGEFVAKLARSDDMRYFFCVHRQLKLVGVGRLAADKQHVEIELIPARMLSGRIVDPDGRPVSGAQVAPLPMTCFHVLTDSDGRFDVGWSPEWHAPNQQLCLLARHVELNLAAVADITPEASTIDIELEPALALIGSVEGIDGKPVPDARVGLSLIKGWGAGTPVKEVITDSQGLFELPALPQRQEYGIGADADGYVRGGIKTGIINNVADRERVGPITLEPAPLQRDGTAGLGRHLSSERRGDKFIIRHNIPKTIDEVEQKPEEEFEAIKSILIETKILSVTYDFLEEIELDANSVRTSGMWSELLIADSTDEPNRSPYQLILDELSASLLTRAAAADEGPGEGSKIAAAPQVFAADGKQAIIKIANSKYYFLSLSDPNHPSGKTQPEAQSMDVGTTIHLTPYVMADDENVHLDFEWELRQIRGFEQQVGPDKKKLKVPLVAVDSIKTAAVIPDGKTLLLGGKKISRWTSTKLRKPILGKLPLVGRFFRSENLIADTRYILILVKPTVNPSKPTPPPPRASLDPDDPLPRKLQEKFESSTAPK